MLMNGKAAIVKKMESLGEVWRNLPRSNDKKREEGERFYEEKIISL
ncbi:Uncharacterized [Moorella glycerini]|uniref:Uncharacterized protein n=1 Tax=Neomoorella stamsii TaxID=1266720 RepID=A0A9X7P4W3_9FIRM|nr:MULTISPECIES: hypothetical protein [Moorella]PRR69351.1 hypothetical protein MOST_30840 [Moorella stamsii]CEP66645.1 Uncharacterized [Moorella glycerini]